MKTIEFIGHPPYREDMDEIEKETYRFLDNLAIKYHTICHDAIFSMKECKDMEQALRAIIPKNLFLCNRQKTQFYLLMMPGEKAFNPKQLSADLGCPHLSFADERQMVGMLGIHPGAVSPMGLIHEHDKKVLPVIDRALIQYEYIGCHPCVNTVTIRLKTADLLNRIIPESGHHYRIVDLKP